MIFTICCTDRLDRKHFRAIKAESLSDACKYVEECIRHDVLVWDDINLCDEDGVILVRFMNNGRVCGVDGGRFHE